jgi:hypothetical protein
MFLVDVGHPANVSGAVGDSTRYLPMKTLFGRMELQLSGKENVVVASLNQ